MKSKARLYNANSYYPSIVWKATKYWPREFIETSVDNSARQTPAVTSSNSSSLEDHEDDDYSWSLAGSFFSFSRGGDGSLFGRALSTAATAYKSRQADTEYATILQQSTTSRPKFKVWTATLAANRSHLSSSRRVSCPNMTSKDWSVVLVPLLGGRRLPALLGLVDDDVYPSSFMRL